MNTLKIKALMISAALLCADQGTAVAALVPLDHEACVAMSLDKAINSILDYGNYSKLPGATLIFKDCDNCIGIPGAQMVLGNKQMLKMLFSGADRFTRDGWNSSAHVATVLWPAPESLKEPSFKNFFPRFFLNCNSKKVSDASFQLECHQDLTVDAKYTYAIHKFDSLLKLSTDSGRCKDGRALLEFHGTIITNDQEVSKIKEAIAPWFPNNFIDAFFNQDTFFKMFFKNFYNRWSKSS